MTAGLTLDDGGEPISHVRVLQGGEALPAARRDIVVIGLGPVEADVCDVVITDDAEADATMAYIGAAVRATPRAALTLTALLRITASVPVAEGLAAESAARLRRTSPQRSSDAKAPS